MITNFPKAIYVLSGDPMHYSHLNTKRTAEKQLGMEVSLLIGINKLKNNGLFTIEERKEIAKFYVESEEIIYTSETKEDLGVYILNAEKIVRGFRDENDKKYLYMLVDHYGFKEQLHKLFPVQVPYILQQISSSNLKQSILDGTYNQKKMHWVPDSVYKILQKKLQKK